MTMLTITFGHLEVEVDGVFDEEGWFDWYSAVETESGESVVPLIQDLWAEDRFEHLVQRAAKDYVVSIQQGG